MLACQDCRAPLGLLMADDPIPIPVRYKQPPGSDEMTLVPVDSSPCNHLFATYLVCESEAEVTCGRCGVRLNRYGSWPGWRQKVHLEEMKHLNERSRAQCEWRGRMTGISHFTELRVTPHPQPS
jgi:hypothetical protein